jgi:hypothetical protein
MAEVMILQVLRSARVLWLLGVSCAVLLGVATARADTTAPSAPPTGPLTIDGLPGRRVIVDLPVYRNNNPYATISQILVLERCSGDCTVFDGGNDARANSSMIPEQPVSTLSEFVNSAGLAGAAADAEWAQVVQCMKEVYSPYNVLVTDQPPAAGLTFHKAIIAGTPRELNLEDERILGVAQVAGDCSPIDNVLSFTFANAHARDPLRPLDRVLNLCWTAAQESAHAFGLDHQFSFSNNRSACNDPMTYRTDCGGQKFFRNELASCGEDSVRACRCGPNQNSHSKLVQVFGAGTPITGNPTVELTSPATSGGIVDRVISARAGSKRGIARVEVLFNGYKWAEVPGVPFGREGQPNPGDYNIVIPTALPNSIVDIVAVAYDDLGVSTQTSVITATRGAACQNASGCALGQKCEAGKCFWDPAAGELGDSCTYPQFCKSGLCRGTKDEQICTHECLPFVSDSCEAGFECVPAENSGVCFFPDSGGCCSVDRSSRGWLANLVLAIAVLGFVARRRRR